jgi:hypothetical protein
MEVWVRMIDEEVLGKLLGYTPLYLHIPMWQGMKNLKLLSLPQTEWGKFANNSVPHSYPFMYYFNKEIL